VKAFEIGALSIEPGEESTTLRLSGEVVLSPAEVDDLRHRLKPYGAKAQRDQQVKQIVTDRRTRLRADNPAPRRTSGLSSRREPAVPDTTRRLIERRSGGFCELRLPGCWGEATDAAHRKGQKAGGRFGQAKVAQSQASAVLHSCRHCHDLTTSAVQPFLSGYRLQGFLLMENQDPLQVPVLLKHVGRKWLDDAGAYCDEPPSEVA
jgi:hypothetical protein